MTTDENKQGTLQAIASEGNSRDDAMPAFMQMAGTLESQPCDLR
jgi:hypothetical protein